MVTVPLFDCHIALYIKLHILYVIFFQERIEPLNSRVLSCGSHILLNGRARIILPKTEDFTSLTLPSRDKSLAVWSAFLSTESDIHWSFFYPLLKSQMVNCIELYFFDITSTIPRQNRKWLSAIMMKDLYANMNDSWLCVLKPVCYYFSFLVQINAVLQWLSFLL